jgi:hypothetical protein
LFSSRISVYTSRALPIAGEFLAIEFQRVDLDTQIRLATRHDRQVVAKFVAGSIQARMMRPGVLLNAAIFEGRAGVLGVALFEDTGKNRLELKQIFPKNKTDLGSLSRLAHAWVQAGQWQQEAARRDDEDRLAAERLAAKLLAEIEQEAHQTSQMAPQPTINSCVVEEEESDPLLDEAQGALAVTHALLSLRAGLSEQSAWEPSSTEELGVNFQEIGVGHPGQIVANGTI